MSSLKGRRAKNPSNIVGKENEDPDCKSPRRKKGRMAESQVGHLAFEERSSNLTCKKMGNSVDGIDKENRGSKVAAHLPHSGIGRSLIRPRYKEMSEKDQDPNLFPYGEKKIMGENLGKYPLQTQKVDNYFQKTYKSSSPTNKRDDAERPSGSISNEMCEGVEGLNEATDTKRKLVERGKSICNIDVTGVQTARQATCFVFDSFVDSFIMTCAHLFRGFVEGKHLKEGTNVSVLFNYHGPQPNRNSFVFTVEEKIVAISEELDYIFLKLKPDVQNPNRVPPGLLECFGPLPENGKIFIIGHPRREAKQIDPTFVINIENREQAVNNHLAPHQDKIFFPLSVIQIIETRGIHDLMPRGVKANQVVTYTTKMYEGASGSPVFDAHGQVFGLHTGGYGYGFPHTINSALEYAQRLDLIIPDLMRQLKESGNEQLLKRIEFVASKNEHLKKVLESDQWK